MSSSELSEDSYDYEDYTLERYEILRPPLIKKKSRLIAAVARNEVDILRELLDSPKWYNVKDNFGYSLLQIAIQQDNKEVFDYMLSIPNFPLEFVNEQNETALNFALTGFISKDQWVNQHFAYELVKKGACINSVWDKGNTALHCALKRSYDKVALLLIQSGADLNACNNKGLTPLKMAVEFIEVFTALLVEGAVPSVEDFEHSVRCDKSSLIQELLFLHSVDQYSVVCFDILTQLAEDKSPLFHEIIKYSCEMRIPRYHIYPSCRDFCHLDADYMKLIVQRYATFLDELLHNHCYSNWNTFYNETFRIESLDVLVESKLKFTIIDLLAMLDSSKLFDDLLDMGCSESRVAEVYLYLLSYGLVLREIDLQMVYKKFGHCELFKLLLHMDVEQSTQKRMDMISAKDVVAVFKYDITMNFERFLKNPFEYTHKSISELFGYFVHPGLIELYYRLTNEEGIPKCDKITRIPSLLELARNSFRNHFIDTFQIKTSRKFYTLLNHLPISIVYKKIISYETKLY